MKIIYKVLLANIVLSFGLALIFQLSQGANNTDSFGVTFGLACMGVGMVDLFISIILFVVGNESREWAQGFLLSWGILILVGFAVCSSSFKLH